LHLVGKQLDQRQAARHPTGAAVKAARQLLQAVAEVALQFCQQPAFLQCRLPLAPAQRTIQHQCFGFRHRPDHRFHGVPAQLLEGGDALVTVNHQVAARLIGQRDYHNRRLLATGGQGSQQVPLPFGATHPQMLPAPVELMKLQLHG
jgi:hypothetical protein